MKRDLKGGRVRLADVLRDPPGWVETAKVGDLLMAVPKVGRVKCNGVLRRAGVSPSRTVGGLSARQRAELVAILEQR